MISHEKAHKSQNEISNGNFFYEPLCLLMISHKKAHKSQNEISNSNFLYEPFVPFNDLGTKRHISHKMKSQTGNFFYEPFVPFCGCF
jgi:hypothetical protein